MIVFQNTLSPDMDCKKDFITLFWCPFLHFSPQKEKTAGRNASWIEISNTTTFHRVLMCYAALNWKVNTKNSRKASGKKTEEHLGVIQGHLLLYLTINFVTFSVSCIQVRLSKHKLFFLALLRPMPIKCSKVWSVFQCCLFQILFWNMILSGKAWVRWEQ